MYVFAAGLVHDIHDIVIDVKLSTTWFSCPVGSAFDTGTILG